jgi:ActR/RegA family two-component response regulator
MNKREILIVEDDSRFRNAIKRAFKDEDYIFFEADSVQEGVRQFNENPNIKVILLDLSLPDGNGRDFLEQIKDSASKYRTIILTAHEELMAAEIAGEFSAFNYLPKAAKSFRQSIRFSVAQAFKDIEKESLLKETSDVILNHLNKAIKIFLSYAREDYPKVDNLYKELIKRNFSVWMDKKNISPGAEWQLEIKRLIETYDFFLACFSSNSVSKEGVVQAERKLALERQSKMPEGRTYIIPIRLDECDISESFKKWHCLDLFESEKDPFDYLEETLLSKKRF